MVNMHDFRDLRPHTSTTTTTTTIHIRRSFNHLEYHALREARPDWRADAGPAVILGAGGAARAIVAGLQDAGAPEIRIANRTPERSAAIRDEFGKPVRPVLWDQRADSLEDAALVVNTTSLGMEGQPPTATRICFAL